MKKIIQFKLKILAKLILWRYQPKVIGITGSVGKTTTKEVLASVLKHSYNIRSSQKNYNNELGVPLTIIGADAQGRSVGGWVLVFLKAIILILIYNKDYPEVLILEMGIDKPGDMDYLTSIVKPDVGIVTMIGHSHLENFGSIERIRKEKGKLIMNIKKGGTAIINYDNLEARKIINMSRVKTLTYGFDKKANIKAQEVNYIVESIKGERIATKTSFKFGTIGSSIPVVLDNSIANSRIYSVLATVGVAEALGLNLIEVASSLKGFRAPKGRLNFIQGVKGSILVDDTYNASPESAIEAIEVLSRVNLPTGSKRIAVFGDMLELGNYEAEGHKEVGNELCKNKYDYILTIGSIAKIISESADNTPKGCIAKNFNNKEELIDFLISVLAPSDLVLIKGSQGARMEKIVKALMKYPEKAKELLVRQSKDWD